MGTLRLGFGSATALFASGLLTTAGACSFDLDILQPAGSSGTGGAGTGGSTVTTTEVSSSTVTSSVGSTVSSTVSTTSSTSTGMGGGGGGPCPVVGTTEPFTDDFSSVGAYWKLDGGSKGDANWVKDSVEIQVAKLEMFSGLLISSGDQAHSYQLQNCWTSLKVDPSGLQSSAQAYLRMRLSNSNFQNVFEVDLNSDGAVTVMNFSTPTLTPVTTTGTAQAYIRLREEDGSTFVETTDDGGSWTEIAKTTSPSWFQTPLALQFGVKDLNAGHDTPDGAVFSHYNLAP